MKLVHDLIVDNKGSISVIKAGTIITEISKSQEYKAKMRGQSDINISPDAPIEDIDLSLEMIDKAVDNAKLIDSKFVPSDGESYVSFDTIEFIVPLGYPVNSKEDSENLLELVRDWYVNDGDVKLKDKASLLIREMNEKYMTVDEVKLVSRISGVYDIKVIVLNHDIDTDYTPDPESTYGVEDITYKDITYVKKPRNVKKKKGKKDRSAANKILKMQQMKRYPYFFRRN